MQRGKGIEQSMIFNRCTIHLYLLYLQTDANSDLAMSSGLSHNYNNLCYIQYVTGDELKNARKASAWTQAQAAARLGVTQAYLSMVERGERAVSSELASKAVEVFEVPATALPLTEYWTAHPRRRLLPVDAGQPGLSGLCLSAQFGPIESGGSADGGAGLGRSGLAGHRGAGMAATGLPASELGLADRECKAAGSPEPAGVCGRAGAAGRRERWKLPVGRGTGHTRCQAGVLPPGERRYSVQRIDDTRRAGLAARSIDRSRPNTGIC